jgi:phosphohistidine phosphatase
LQLFLVHHGDAVGADVDPQRPLSPKGREAVERAAENAAGRGARPAVVWHSGKLRARQTALAFWRACNALAEFSATRDLQPDDPPAWLRDRLRGEPRDILIAGHFPHLPRLLALLLAGAAQGDVSFPLHGVVALETTDDGETWQEQWRIEVEA